MGNFFSSCGFGAASQSLDGSEGHEAAQQFEDQVQATSIPYQEPLVSGEPILLSEKERKRAASLLCSALVSQTERSKYSLEVDLLCPLIVRLQTAFRGCICRCEFKRITLLIRIQSALKAFHHRIYYRRFVYKTRIAEEILQTEETYVNDLGVIIDVFLAQFRSALSNQTSGSKQKLLDNNEIKIVFSDIEALHGIHKQFLDQLRGRMANWHIDQSLGDIFQLLLSFVPAYSTYVNNYDYASQLLNELRENRPALDTFLREQRANPRCLRKELQDFLITPIQRVPRYVLLLQELVKRSDEAQADFSTLSHALQRLRELANRINDRKRVNENTREVQRIHQQLDPPLDLSEPHRQFIREGSLNLKYRHGSRRYSRDNHTGVHLFLFNDVLLVCRARKLKRAKFKTLHWFSLDCSRLISEEKDIDDHEFKVSDSNELMIFSTSSQEEKKEWSEQLQAAIRVSKELRHEKEILAPSPAAHQDGKRKWFNKYRPSIPPRLEIGADRSEHRRVTS